MTMRTVRPYDPDELWLLPPSPRDWLPEDHVAYFLSDLVDALDLQPILETSHGVKRGPGPYQPQMLVTGLLDAYAGGSPASRQMAREREEDVACRVLAATQRPDFRTLSEFRKPHLAALFVQVLKLCQRAGLVKLGPLALDGTQVKATASKPKAMRDGRMVTEEARLQAEVMALLQQAEAADTRDDATSGPDRRGEELPAELARREQRLQTLRAAKAVLEQEAPAEAAVTQAARAVHDPARPRRGRPPVGLSVADRMRRTLRTKRGRSHDARRKAIVEPVFGQIKQGRGFRQFLLRGLRKVRGAWALICTTHHGLKLWTALRHRRRRPGEGLRALSGGRKANRRDQR